MCIQVRLIEQYLFYLNFKGLVFVFAVYPVAEQLNRWLFHWVTEWLSHTFSFGTHGKPMVGTFDQPLVRIKHFRQFLTTLTILDNVENFGKFWTILTILDNLDNFDNFENFENFDCFDEYD